MPANPLSTEDLMKNLVCRYALPDTKFQFGFILNNPLPHHTPTSRNLQRFSMGCHHTIYETRFTINKTFISILHTGKLLPLNDLKQYQ